MFIIISWIFAGAIFGSVGVAFLASAVKGPSGGEVDIGTVFFWLFVTTVLGGVGGGMLARMVRRKLGNDRRRLDGLAILPLVAAAILVGYAALKP